MDALPVVYVALLYLVATYVVKWRRSPVRVLHYYQPRVPRHTHLLIANIFYY